MTLDKTKNTLITTIAERYHEDFAKWSALSWVTMARQALESLKGLLESHELTWDRPHFAYYLLCEWDWKAWEKSQGWEGPSLKQCEDALETSSTDIFARALTRFLYTDFLRKATFGASRLRTTDNKIRLHVEFPEDDPPLAIRALYDAIKEKQEEGIYLNERVYLPTVLMKPFRFGIQGLTERFPPEEAASIFTAFMEKASNAAATEDGAEANGGIQTEETDEAFMDDILSFKFTNLETGQTFNITAVVELSPVLLEPEVEKASFPVVVGLEATEDGDPVSLATLPPGAHEDLWKEIFNILDHIEKGWNTSLSERLFRGILDLQNFTKKEAPLEHLPSRLILDTPTREDSRVRAHLSMMKKVNLPKRWENIPRVEDLEKKRIEAIKNEFGLEEGAKRGLLKKNRKGRKGGELEVEYELSKAESERLRDSLDGKTFREERNDPGRGERLAIVKRVKTVDGAMVEVAFSWYGMDWKLVEGGREKMEEAFKGILEKDEERLFPELNSRQRDRLLRQIEHIAFLRDSERLMGLLVDRFGQKGSSVFSIPLWELKAFFEIEADPHALDRINGAFFCLTKLEFTVVQKAKSERHGSIGGGPFLVFYELPTGADGDVVVEVSQWAIGALKVFEKGRKAYPYQVNINKLEEPAKRPSDEVVEYDFSQKANREKRKELSKALSRGSRIIHKATSVNGHLVNAMADGDRRKKQRLEHLLNFMASEQTLNRDPRHDKRPPERGADRNEPRLYGREFCPLLEERRLTAALSHQKHNPESGRKLYGGSPQASPRSGGSPEGLLYTLGFYETSKAGRRREIKEALLLMVEVVEETLGGLVALKNGAEWFRVQDVIENEDHLTTVGRDYRVHLFFPKDYLDRLYDKYHDYQERRSKELGLPHKVEITRDRDLHRKNDLDRPSSFTVDVEAKAAAVKRLEEITPLHERLSGARLGRGLTQKDLGLVFGVSGQTVKLWESYTKGELGRIVKGRPIPRELVPLVERWIREKAVPTNEELSALKSRRPGRAQKE